jgi:hypothetical protein|tara:strand:- start:3810 stop:4634 length:825 start_codon:yes stop_codon:yes gene_type:complete
MKLIKISIFFFIVLALSSCAENKKIVYDKDSGRFILTEKKRKEEIFFFHSSHGFALIYDQDLYKEGVINKKLDLRKDIDKRINDTKVIVLHSFLKKGTPVKIINPENSKVVETKIHKLANYPKIFNVVISRKTAKNLGLDFNNPYVELFETKKNITFVAKEGVTFDEEKNVAEKIPVDEIKMDDLSKEKMGVKINIAKKNKFILVIADFYYFDSAKNLKNDLIKQTKIRNFLIKKINDNKYRLSVGPFKNFNALKFVYISLNNLGFEDLNIYRE